MCMGKVHEVNRVEIEVGSDVFVLDAGGLPKKGKVVDILYSGSYPSSYDVRYDGITETISRRSGRVSLFPKVGMPVTDGAGSDCYPGTIIRVSPSGREIEYTQDEYRYTGDPKPYGDPGEPALWEYTQSDWPHGRTSKLRKGGHWDGRVTIGVRKFYQDPSF